jgi:hypothetical protein
VALAPVFVFLAAAAAAVAVAVEGVASISTLRWLGIAAQLNIFVVELGECADFTKKWRVGGGGGRGASIYLGRHLCTVGMRLCRSVECDIKKTRKYGNRHESQDIHTQSNRTHMQRRECAHLSRSSCPTLGQSLSLMLY